MKQILAALCLGCLLAGWQSSAHAQAQCVVFLLPSDLDTEARSSLEDALVTQLALVDVRIVALTGPSGASAPPLETRVSISKALAAEHRALGVLWLDVRPTDHWFVYATDAQAERVVVRPLLVRRESVPAAIETVAVIARGSAEALLHGEPVVGEPVAEAPAPKTLLPPPAAPAPKQTAPASDPASRLRLAVAYAGTTFAENQRWQSGAQLSVAWLWPQGPYAALSFTWIAPHRFGSELAVSVQSQPFSLALGHRFELRREIRLDVEVGGVLDMQSRHTSETPSGLVGTDDKTRLLYGIAPSTRLEYALTDWLGLFGGVACDIFFNDFGYISSSPGGTTLLDPYRVRLRALTGLALLH